MTSRAGKYARFEFERRFLANRVPSGLRTDTGWRIYDRYIKNTHLRLRRQEPLGGGETIYKLGQKNAPSPPDFARTTMTTLYLSRGEYDVLANLPARELRKQRKHLSEGGRTFSVDVFEESLAGLVLAEVTVETSRELDEEWQLPGWVSREVSDDIRFTGAALAGLSTDQLADLIRS
jgi:CYTH domain-containing protein